MHVRPAIVAEDHILHQILTPTLHRHLDALATAMTHVETGIADASGMPTTLTTNTIPRAAVETTSAATATATRAMTAIIGLHATTIAKGATDHAMIGIGETDTARTATTTCSTTRDGTHAAILALTIETAEIDTMMIGLAIAREVVAPEL